MDLLSRVLAQEVLDEVVGHREEFGRCRRGSTNDIDEGAALTSRIKHI